MRWSQWLLALHLFPLPCIQPTHPGATPFRYKKIGITANNDQAAAVAALLKKWEFLDPSRVGIWGWSGGGSSTLQAMFRFPDVYAAGASIAFISDQRFYDTIYQVCHLACHAPHRCRSGSNESLGCALCSQLCICCTGAQERYMGVPPGAAGKPVESDDGSGWRHYVEGSPVSHVAGLKGELLLAYGTGDDNCHYQVRCNRRGGWWSREGR